MNHALAVQRYNNLSALAPRIEILAGLDARTRSANDPDYGIKIVEGNLQTFEDVFAGAVFLQQEDRAPLDNVDAMIDERPNRLIETQLPRLPIQHREEDHGE